MNSWFVRFKTHKFRHFKGLIKSRLLVQLGQYSVMAENPGLLNNEEFEKVDHDQYTQDENITSTSMTGEMAEEDRYQGDGEGDLLGDEYTSTTVQGSAYQEQAEPLISFESSPPPVLMEPAPETTVMEPSAPPPPTSMKSVSETDATESAGGIIIIAFKSNF